MGNLDPWVLAAIAGLAALAVYMAKSEANPEAPPLPAPPERPPPEHEVKQALADLRASLERLQAVLEKQHDQHKDELRDIQRQLDRIENSRRLEDLVAGIHRKEA